MKQNYKTLGLQEGASQEEIEAAYKRLSKELDPSNNDNQEFFIEEYKKLHQAYKALNASSILATKQGAKNVYSKPKEEKSQKDEPANTKPPKSHTNKTKVIGFVLAVLAGIILTTVYFTPKNFKENQIVFVENIAYEKHTMVLFNGKIKDSFYEGKFKDGLKEGTHLAWKSCWDGCLQWKVTRMVLKMGSLVGIIKKKKDCPSTKLQEKHHGLKELI